jgi:hypothetical protein
MSGKQSNMLCIGLSHNPIVKPLDAKRKRTGKMG